MYAYWNCELEIWLTQFVFIGFYKIHGRNYKEITFSKPSSCF